MEDKELEILEKILVLLRKYGVNMFEGEGVVIHLRNDVNPIQDTPKDKIKMPTDDELLLDPFHGLGV